MASNLGNVGKDLKHTDHLLDEEKIHHKIGQQQPTNLISDNLSSVVKIKDPKQNELTNDADLTPKIKIETPVKKSTSVDDKDSPDITVKLCHTGNQKSKICSDLQDCKINAIPQDESGIVETQKICSTQTVHKSGIIDVQQVYKHKQNELSKTLHDDVNHCKAQSADKNGIGVTDSLNLSGNDDKLLFLPSLEDNNSSSVGFDYCENIDLDSTNSTNFSNISQIKGCVDNKVRVGSEETSNNQKNLSCCISVSSNCVSEEKVRAVKPNTVLCSQTLDDKRLIDSKVEPKYDLITDSNQICDKTIPSAQSLCSKRKSPSVQDRRLKLDALVENIKSLKAAELKEQSISVDVKDTTSSGLPQGTISCEKEVSASLKNEERLDSLNQQIDNNDSNCVKLDLTTNVQENVVNVKTVARNVEDDGNISTSVPCVNVKCTDGVSDKNQQLNPNNSLTKTQGLETNTAKQLYYELDKNFTKQDEETENNCSDSCGKVEDDRSVDVENKGDVDKSQDQNTTNSGQDVSEVKSESTQGEQQEKACIDSLEKSEVLKQEKACIDSLEKSEVLKQEKACIDSLEKSEVLKQEKACIDSLEKSEVLKQEKACIDSLEKSEVLKQSIFHIDRQNDKKIYEFSDVIGNKQPVVCLGERVSKDNALDQSETNKLHKLVKTKKPVKKIEMIRHPSRRMKRVASLNALAMVNILFGKDESPPKSHKPTEKVVPKKVVSSKSLSKAKLILEAKVKCLLKKAKTPPQEKDENEDQGHTNIKKEKTSPKKISQIEKSLANLSLDSPPTKLTSEKSNKKQSSPPKSPTKTSTKSLAKTSTSSKCSTKASPPKSPTKISSPSKSSNKINSGTTKTKAKGKNKENSEVKKSKKKLDEKQVKGENNKKSGEKGKKEDKTINRKNSESDKSKDKVPKPRRKKGELLRSARTHSFHEIKRTKSDIVENDKVQNSKCSNCQSSWKNDGDKNSYVEGSVQYNMGHVDGGTYSTHSYGVVQSMPGSCVHCSQNGGLYSSQGPLSQSSSFIGGIMGQPGSLVSPCQTFTIGSVPMVQYHHPFGTGYPIQYQSHNTLPHCGCPTCYYYTPTASPLPHHDTCHHSVPPSYTPVRDDLGGVVPPSYSSSHDDLDPDIDVVGGVSPHHASDHHLSSSGNCVDVDVEIDVVGGVPPVTFNDKAILQTLKKKRTKSSSESETKSKLDKNKSSKSGNDKAKVSKSNKENKDKCGTKKDSEEKKKDKNKLESKKTVNENSEKATDEVKTNKKKSQSQEDVKIGKAKTLSQLSEELRANKKKILSKPSDDSKTVKKNANKLSEDLKTNKKRTLSKSSDDQAKTVKKQKLSTSVEEPKVVTKKLFASKRKSVDDVFSSDQPAKQNKTLKTESKKQTVNKSFNRSKSVDAKVLKENQCSKSYPKRKRLLSLTRQTSTELITVPRRKSSSSKSTPANKTEKKKVETKKPKKRNHNWEFQSVAEKKKITVAGTQVERDCYPAIRHTDGDLIYVRDVVILRSGPRKTDIPYLGKVTAFWEENDEMMMSLLWYYHPEHTDTGRQSHHLPVEIFASKHRDENSIACIDDKGYVLTYNEYCRYRAEKCRVECTLPPRPMIVPVLEENPRLQRIPPPDVDSNTVYMCRQVYDFKLKRILKNPS